MTLIELMIAILILGIVIAVALNVAFTIMNGYRDHRRAMVVERAARGSIMVLSDAVRNASPGVQNATIFDVVGCSSLRGIDVVNHTDEPDELKLMYATGGIVTSIREVFDQDGDSLTLTDASAIKDGDHLLVTDFTHGRIVLVKGDPAEAGGEWAVPLDQAPVDKCVFVPALDNTFSYAVLATVLRVQVARFFIDDSTDLPVLMMDPDGEGPLEPEPVAEGIEDLQIAIGIDDDGDGAIEEVGEDGGDDEWYYNHPDDTPPLLSVTAKPYRAIRLTIVARSTDETSTVAVATSIRPEAEDHDAAGAADVYKRRTLSTTVEIRNFSGSPL